MNLAPIAAIPDQPLGDALALVDKHFNQDEILNRPLDLAAVEEYYRQSDRGYRMFHSREGALHIALGCDGHRDTSGYPRQAEIFLEHLRVTKGQSAIELGCGMGYNTRWLAEHGGDRTFLGVDLTESHVDYARQQATKFTNAQFEVANYEQLPHEANSFDGALAVETLCQTANLEQALSEAQRVLRPGARLVVVDCFRRAPLESFDSDLQQAARLVERTTAVEGFAVVEDWIELAASVGLRLVEATDLSDQTTANLARLYSLARRFFKMPLAARVLGKTMPPLLLENSICGLLMPYTVGHGAHTYQSIVVEK